MTDDDDEWRVCVEDGTGSGSTAFRVWVEPLAGAGSGSPLITLRLTPPGQSQACERTKVYSGGALPFDYTLDFPQCPDTAATGQYEFVVLLELDPVVGGQFTWPG
jgi:hypothetical protein